MSVSIVASLGAGHRTLQNREIQHLEVSSRLGEPHHCLIRFDLDTSSGDCLQDFQGDLAVNLADTESGEQVALFKGIMTGGTQDHQLDGGSRFEIHADSPLLLAMSHHESATKFSTPWDVAASSLGLSVIGAPRYKVPVGGYAMFGQTRLEFVQRMADDAGFFVIERDGAVQLRSEFDDAARCTLTWGVDLLALRAESSLRNHRFRGGVYEEKAKADYRFRDQRRDPVTTGALKLTTAVKNAAPSFGDATDANVVMSDSRATTRDVFRDALLRESERALGAAVLVAGESRNIHVALGSTVQVDDGASAKLTGSTGVFGIIELRHVWDSAEYRNAFTGSPWKNFSNAIRPPLVPVPGPFLAEALQTDPAVVAKGFLHVRLAHMDRDGESFQFARLVAPFGGNGRGVVFVPEPGDEVLVDFLQGDPEHAIVVGSLWNGKDVCPGQEPKQIVTKSGNVLALHDDGWIELYTPKGKCMLQMSSTSSGTPRVTLHSEGDLVLEAKGQIQLRGASLHEAIGGGVKRDITGDEVVKIGGSMTHEATGLMKHKGGTGSIVDGAGSTVALSADSARMTSPMSVVEGTAAAIVSAAMVELNPPAVPPAVPVVEIPAQVPDALATTWKERGVPPETPLFDTGQDSGPGA